MKPAAGQWNLSASVGVLLETSEAAAPKTGVMPTFVYANEPSYPSSLRELPRPAAGLWCRGELPPPSRSLVAIVGSRAASAQGCALAHAFAHTLASRGFGVVSGGALGIDAAAHEGALAGGGTTYAVLGCGVDVVYPDRHTALFERIAAQGALLSEYPPGTPPRSGQFPVRNRLIVGLAEVVLVVEARLRSGALVTARLAHQLGRRLWAVPGTAGTDALIHRGMAWAVRDLSELDEALAGRRSSAPSAAAPPSGVLPILNAIAKGMHTPAALALYLGRPLSDVMAALMEAEIDGWVHKGAGSHYEVTNGH